MCHVSPKVAKTLLGHCELDTMAMVFIWEYFNHMCKEYAESGGARLSDIC